MKVFNLNISPAIKREVGRDKHGSYAKLAAVLARNFTEVQGQSGHNPKGAATKKWRVDRRKLKQIAEWEGKTDLTISMVEFMVLDAYFRKTGEGFAEQPLFSRQSILKDFSENSRSIFFIGAFARDLVERTDVSLWDVKAFRDLTRAVHSFEQGVRAEIRDVPFLNDTNGSQNTNPSVVQKVLSEPRRSVCCIGSPRANMATEAVLAEMFGIDPFSSTEAGRLPFRFYWSEYQSSRASLTKSQASYNQFKSAFRLKEHEVSKIDPEIPNIISSRPTSAVVIENEKKLWITRPRTGEWDDFGVVAVDRQDKGRIRLVIAGLTGPSTYACATACINSISIAAPATPGEVIWCVVRTRLAAKAGVGDTREIRSIDLAVPPTVWRRNQNREK